MPLPRSFIRQAIRKTAITAVAPSALRGQGKGCARGAHEFLSDVRLGRIPRSSVRAFRAWLDRQTDALDRKFPVRQSRWGGARKVINIFLRDAMYHRYLCHEYRLAKLEPWLEVPLDNLVANALKRDARCHGRRGELLPWCGLKRVKPRVNAIYQEYAAEMAKRKGIARVHLDLYLIVNNRPE
jgi:hypothetical protein